MTDSSYSEEFSIVYDGPALKEHKMDAGELDAILSSVNRLISTSDKIINGKNSEIQINVTSLSKGSVIIEFHTFALNILNSPNTTAVCNLATLGGVSICAVKLIIKLFEWIKSFRGQRPNKMKELDKSTVRIQYGNQIADIPIEIWNLIHSPDARQDIENIIAKFLERKGIETFEIRNKGEKIPLFSAANDDAIYFKNSDFDEELINQYNYHGRFIIEGLGFKREDKWRLSDGNSTISAVIEGDVFWQYIENGEQFQKGDILDCEIYFEQFRGKKNLVSKYAVIKILRHQHSSQFFEQKSFDF